MMIALIEQEKYTKIKLKLILVYGAYLKKRDCPHETTAFA